MTDKFGSDILFARMIGILTQENLDALATKTVAVPGAGGAGFTHAESMVRMGIGRMKIADFDTFDAINIGRQFGATIHTVGRRKVEVLEERLRSINPALAVDAFDGVTEDNIGKFLDGVDVVCDAIDYFSIPPRRLLHREARKRGIPVVFAGPVGFGATLFIFDPRGMSLDEYFDFRAGQTEAEMLENFGIGLIPGQLYRHSLDNQNLDFRNHSGSVLSSTCLLCTALVGIAALTLLVGKSIALKPVPHVYQIDLAAAKLVDLDIPGGVRDIRNDPRAYMR